METARQERKEKLKLLLQKNGKEDGNYCITWGLGSRL